MRLSEGVEWATHACVLLGALPEGRSLPRTALAEFLDVPPAYLAKHMQALSRAGLVGTGRGPSGGYRLAKPREAISLNDIVLAIEGRESAFRCQEVRQRGPGRASKEECKRPCGIAASFYGAERAWRAELAKVTIANVTPSVSNGGDPKRRALITKWFMDNVR